MMIPFGPWLPDQPAFRSGGSLEALNVIPTQNGYRPFPGFSAVADAVTARAQGMFTCRGLTGTIHNFCGDATKLYKMDSDGLGWTDASRLAGGAYTTAATGWWDFFQFGDTVIAINGADAAQSFTLSSSANFAALGGSSPVASFCGVVRGFGVMLRVSTAQSTVHWSGIEDVTTWAASATTLSDTQILPDSGLIMGFVGGEFGLVFQERAIYRMAFEGPPTAFRFDRIANQLGCRAERSIAGYEGLAFFLSDDGLQMVRGGVEIIPIGSEKFDRWLEDDIDNENLDRISSAVDPINKLYLMGYPSTISSGGSPDTIFVYHWPTGKAARVRVNHEIIGTMATQAGYTLDGLDSVSATLEALPHSLDSRIWTGSGRLVLGGFNTSHAFGYFDGTSLAATIDTFEDQLFKGRRANVLAARPLIQGSSVTPYITPIVRDLLHEPVSVGIAVAANDSGICPLRAHGRYFRGRVTTTAGDVWEHAIGIDDVFAVAGAPR